MRYAIAGTLITIIIIADYEHVYMLKEEKLEHNNYFSVFQ